MNTFENYIPESFLFNNPKESYFFWGLIDSLFIVVAIRGFFDFTSLYTVFFISSALLLQIQYLVKPKQEEHDEKQLQQQEYVSNQTIKELVLNFSKKYVQIMDWIVETNSFTEIAKKVAPIMIAAWLLNHISFFIFAFLGVNTVFVYFLLTNLFHIDVNSNLQQIVDKFQHFTKQKKEKQI